MKRVSLNVTESDAKRSRSTQFDELMSDRWPVTELMGGPATPTTKRIRNQSLMKEIRSNGAPGTLVLLGLFTIHRIVQQKIVQSKKHKYSLLHCTMFLDKQFIAFILKFFKEKTAN